MLDVVSMLYNREFDMNVLLSSDEVSLVERRRQDLGSSFIFKKRIKLEHED